MITRPFWSRWIDSSAKLSFGLKRMATPLLWFVPWLAYIFPPNSFSQLWIVCEVEYVSCKNIASHFWLWNNLNTFRRLIVLFKPRTLREKQVNLKSGVVGNNNNRNKYCKHDKAIERKQFQVEFELRNNILVGCKYYATIKLERET